MPRGSYAVNGRPEAFSCAPGPAGWRYVSDVLDLAVDARFAAVRFEVRAGDRWARGVRASLDDGQRLLAWACSADPCDERLSEASSVETDSPGSLVALVRAAAAPGTDPVRRLLPVVRFDVPALAGLEARRVLTRVGTEWHEAPDGHLLVEQWYVDDVDAGTRVVVSAAGDVVLAAEGPDLEVELTSLDSRPTGATSSPG
ncbi:MAG: hypothetical protein ACLGIA_08905 [Actinomycetes bacterium]